MVGWLVGSLIGNAVFSETALKIFLIFCLKLGDYKGRKVTEPVFWKNSWFWDIREKVSKLAQNQTLWYFSQKHQKFSQIEVFGHFLDFASVFLDFGHNERWAWCLVVFLQFVSPVNVLLLYFENSLRKESKISVETNFTSFVFIYHSKFYFRLYSLPSWKLVFPFVCFFKIVSWKSVVSPIKSEAVVRSSK